MPTESITQKGGIEIFNLVVKFISGAEIISVFAILGVCFNYFAEII